MIEQRNSPAARVSAAGTCSPCLHVLYVFPIVLGDSDAPVANRRQPRADLRESLQAVGFISRKSKLLPAHQIGTCTIQDGRQSLRVGECVMDTGQVSVGKIVWAAIEQPVVSARRHQL